MPIEQRGQNSWRITINLGYDSITRKRLRITKTIQADNRTEAMKVEKIMQAEAVKRSVKNPSNMVLEDFFNYWLQNYARPKLAARTIESYIELFRRINLALGHKRINSIEPKHILAFLDNLRTCPRWDNQPGGLSSATIRKTFIVLHSLFAKAEKWGFVISSPVKNIDAPIHRYQNNRVIMSMEQMGKFLLLLKEKADLKYRVWCNLAIAGGLRREEMYGLQWKHISFTENTIRIEQACVYLKGHGVMIKEPKNKTSVRLVSMPVEVMTLLKRYYQEYQTERDRLANLWQGKDDLQENFVFTTWNGRIGNPDTISKWLRKFVRENKLPQITPHSFRHMTASFLIAAGVDVVTVAGKLGHADSTTTQKVYAHLLQKTEHESADVMGDILSSSIKKAKIRGSNR